MPASLCGSPPINRSRRDQSCTTACCTSVPSTCRRAKTSAGRCLHAAICLDVCQHTIMEGIAISVLSQTHSNVILHQPRLSPCSSMLSQHPSAQTQRTRPCRIRLFPRHRHFPTSCLIHNCQVRTLAAGAKSSVQQMPLIGIGSHV